MKKEIKNYDEFMVEADNQKASILILLAEVKEIYENFQYENKECTIFSVQDDNDGECAYVQVGLRRVNNIGYYILEGEFSLKDGYVEL